MIVKLPKNFHPGSTNPRIKSVRPVVINTLNPISRGLTLAYSPTQSGSWERLVTGERATRSGVEVGPRITPVGVAWGNDGTDPGRLAFDKPIKTSQWSVFSLFRSLSSTDGESTVVNQNFNGSSVPINFALKTGKVDTEGFSFHNGGWTTVLGPVSLAGDGLVHSMGGSKGVDLNLYIDGELFGTQTSVIAGNTANTNPIDIGAYRNDNNTFDGDIYCVFIWNRALSAEELFSLHLSPFQLLEPADDPFYFTADAGIIRTSKVTGGGFADDTVAKNATKTSAVTGGGFIKNLVSRAVARTSKIIGGGFSITVQTPNKNINSDVSGGGFVTQITRKTVARASIVIGGGFLKNLATRGIVRISKVIGGGRLTNIVTRAVAKTSTVKGGGRSTNTTASDKTTTSIVIGGGFSKVLAGVGIIRTSKVTGGGFAKNVAVTFQRILIKNQTIRVVI